MKLRIGGALLLVVAAAALLVALVERPPGPVDLATARPDASAGAGPAADAPSGFPPALRDTRPVVTSMQRMVDLCGYGKVPLDTDLPVLPAQVQGAATQTLTRVADAMAADRDPATRMVGLTLEAWAKAAVAAETERARFASDCDAHPECALRLTVAVRAAFRLSADRMAVEAGVARDARAYALAMSMCASAYLPGRATGPCALLSEVQWAALDPDNVVPWLAAASRASAVGDRAAHEAAMRGAARATSSRLYDAEVLRAAEHPLMTAAPPAVRLAALTDLMGWASAMVWPSWWPVEAHCGKAMQSDSAKRRDCASIAEALMTGSTLNEVGIGEQLAARSGWPDEKRRPIRDKVDAIYALMVADVDAATYGSCEHIETLQQWIGRTARHGEVAAGEQAIARSGRSAAELAQQWRARFPAQPAAAESPRQ
jgi:hypothetical protein